jgi:hypothetical protein
MALLFVGTSLSAQQAPPGDEPRFTSDGQLVRPDKYREWIFLTSGLGMTYGPVEAVTSAANPQFDNVFVTPRAYKAFMETGQWPDKTMFALEVRSAATKGSINKGGHFQEGMVDLEVHVKDTARFPSKWAFVAFGASAPKAKPLEPGSSCQECHSKNGAVDETFVQFYPTLIPVAKAKGTFKPVAGG